MKNGKWYTFLIGSVFLTGIALYGLWIGYQDIVNPPERTLSISEDSRPEPVGDVYVALGDSLTRGVGSTSGAGYVQPVGAALEEDDIRTQNLAISGARTEDLLAQLEQPEVRRTIENARYITLTIGGNDLFNRGENVDNFESVDIEQVVTDAKTNLNVIFEQVRGLNDTAQIVYIALYNPFQENDNGEAFNQLILDWNASAATFGNAQRIDVIDPFAYVSDVSRDLATDQFHPSDRTYEKLAEDVLFILE
ncbi:GDSL-type esterase/lipase family protein [Exiguobacterium aurantiacum]|uniref:GDSL-type esterase/lipase family protein n=1 Tax=Exiguobacterium aurantiacum TaxID=33987 RepID=A0ABY5FJ86_9BACL|nr:GDSL-type esterase/lipase family protein [Exiguobacterium aurantiacum]UTT41630.1 GDSL-type esterase/lipase family protein [Exiguobacterium aurantiacum]